MKIQAKWKIALGLLAAAFGMQACSDKEQFDGTLYPTAMVTVKPNIDNSAFYMQLDENTTLLPVNMTSSPFGKKEVRALVNYVLTEQTSKHYSRAVKVNWIDSIRTKDMAESRGEKNDEVYGADPVEIVNDGVTVAEDGYLTVRFRTRWQPREKHVVNLVAADAKNSYKVTFHHDAKKNLTGTVADGLVAFRLTRLPDTKGKTVDLTLEWRSYSGMKSTTFKYTTRKASNNSAAIALGKYVKNVD